MLSNSYLDEYLHISKNSVMTKTLKSGYNSLIYSSMYTHLKPLIYDPRPILNLLFSTI